MSLSMASPIATVPKTLLLNKPNTPSSLFKNQRLGTGSNSLRISAIAKNWEPTKKSAGGVLLPKSAVKFERNLKGEILSVGADVSDVDAGKKVDLGSEARHCFVKASDMLAVVE